MNKKRTIVLASLLKPVDDTRMFEKLALSMAQTNKYAINIIGFSTKNIPAHPDIRFFPVFHFKRLSLSRWVARYKCWQILVKVKPELIIVNSPDLLSVSCIYKILFGCKIIYDVQENYLQNIIWSSNLPIFIRYPLAYWVRSKETFTKRMIVHFLLAEKCYMNECSFINERWTILENKARSPHKEGLELTNPHSLISLQESSTSGPIRLIYSGTIAESYGIFDCLDLVDQWVKGGMPLHLTIIGYCPREDTLRELLTRINNKSYVSLIGGNQQVPHPQILQELQKAHFSLISYRLNPSSEGCFPTRIWECLAYKLPMIMKPEHPWKAIMEEYGAGITVDYQHPPDRLRVPAEGFYKSRSIPSSFYWEYEEKKLLQVLETLF